MCIQWLFKFNITPNALLLKFCCFTDQYVCDVFSKKNYFNPIIQEELGSCTYLHDRLADIVSPQRAATKENVQRKQARTDGERDDSENEESEDDSPDEADDDVPYNPKNLPLGWDGKVQLVL